jgi:DNA-binding PadR family transcriptional regulator
VSKLYEEPRKLVSQGLARATTEQNGQRTRTVYTITAKGRRALANWLGEPGEGPVLEFEQLLKVFFAENGTKYDALRALHAAEQWAQARSAESLAVGERYAEGDGPFPGRLPELQLTSRFLTDFYVLVLDWARWASSVVEAWPDDPRQAHHDPDVLAVTIRRARVGAHGTQAGIDSGAEPTVAAGPSSSRKKSKSRRATDAPL